MLLIPSFELDFPEEPGRRQAHAAGKGGQTGTAGNVLPLSTLSASGPSVHFLFAHTTTRSEV